MVVFPGRIVTHAEAWFEIPDQPSGVDVMSCRQTRKPIGQAAEFHTLLVDLGATAEEIWKGMKQNFRYEIRRAEERDGLEYEVVAPDALRQDPRPLHAFADFYRAFAQAKGLLPVETPYLRKLADAGLLWLNCARKDGRPLVWHSHVAHAGRARILYGGSHHRAEDVDIKQFVGRANRWLLWRDMKAFREFGYRWFDFGGWYAGSDDAGLLAINRFKESFGGVHVKEYDCVLPLSARGRGYLLAKRAVERIRKGSGSRLVPRTRDQSTEPCA